MASGPNSAPGFGWPPLKGAATNDTELCLPNPAEEGNRTGAVRAAAAADDATCRAAASGPLSLRVADTRAAWVESTPNAELEQGALN
jgi:hypothetical protein